MSKLKQLEIKKLMKELDFVESDFTYKNEIVHEADSNFIKSVNDLLEQHPLLKDVFDKALLASMESIYNEPIEFTTNFTLVVNFGFVLRTPKEISSI